MFIENELLQLGNKNIRVYLDMDGTIVHYDVGNPNDYVYKRPLINRINKIKYLMDKYPNIEFYILSIGHEDKHIVEKNKWLDMYLPEIKKENRVILIRDVNAQLTSATIKKNYLNNLNTDDTIVLIDDDPRILGAILKDNPNNVILYKDSILSD